MGDQDNHDLVNGIAIVGFSGRFPGAASVEWFWKNQLAGVEGISHFTPDELEVAGAKTLATHPQYVAARPILENVEMFDAAFFGFYPKEAELLDPQQRVFLECCWEALENAGYDPMRAPGFVSVYAGSSPSTYFLRHVCQDRQFIDNYTSGYQVSNYSALLGSNLDFLATRVSYKLNLKGPAFTMLAGCSTSLLTVCQAAMALQNFQCDMALAGGVSISFPQKRGYLYQEGAMVSPDGHCRAFDEKANGTVFGAGAGVVVLKRLEDALADGNTIHAVIRGYAMNNDGADKVGYTAPSVDGQAEVIELAQGLAGISADTIGYVEAHGTGTPLGDPIEVAALRKVFSAQTDAKHFCALGTAKTNVGHLDVAAGITGLINALHVVREGVFPPTLHFQKPNPQLQLDDSPFYINTTLKKWNSGEHPRRAGVSAFGVGGTNAHVVIEQAPEREVTEISRAQNVLLVSARSESALDTALKNLAAHCKENPNNNLADMAWTLQTGRHQFDFRAAVATASMSDAAQALADRKRILRRTKPLSNPEICFLFPGQGSQYPNMAREVYETEPVFRVSMDRCAEILQLHLGRDLRHLLFPADAVNEELQREVTATIIAQSAIFAVEYSLAQLWLSWGIRPTAMLGHSVGEFVAACLAGVFSLEDALGLVAARGSMMQALPPGGMLSVRLSEEDVKTRLSGHPELAIAAVNSTTLCVVSGSFSALERLEQQLQEENVMCRRLVTSHAFHSAMMDPIIEPFTALVRKIRLHAPSIPYVSGVTGKWITAEQTADTMYWARHFRQSVQFAPALTELCKGERKILLEVGPGNVLSTLARQQSSENGEHTVVTSLADGFSGKGDTTSLMNALGSLWLAGAQPEWKKLYGDAQPCRIPLPTYPFERKRYWIDPPSPEEKSTQPVSACQAGLVLPEKNAAEENGTMNSVSTTQSKNGTTRVEQLIAALKEMLESISGMDMLATEANANFLELGFDSLFLTQVAQELHGKFGVKITFRQLMGELSSVEAVAEFLDKQLPAEIFAPQPTAATMQPTGAMSTTPIVTMPAVSSVAVPTNGTSVGHSPIEQLVREQMQAMNQLFTAQLDVLRASISSGPSSAPLTLNAVAPQSVDAIPALAPVDVKTVPLPTREEFKAYGRYKPPQKGVQGNLTPPQAEGLEKLVEKYTRQTASSKKQTAENRRNLADPRAVSGFRSQWKEMVYPIVVNGSKGSKLWDADGNEYIDLVNGFGPIMLGHRPDFVERAIVEQLQKGIETGPQAPLAGEVARMFCKMTGAERMTFCNTGSEAVMAALRVARTVTGRSKVVLFTGDYHGLFDEVLVKGVKSKTDTPNSFPIAPGIPRESVANAVVLDYGTQKSLEWIRNHANELAAVLVEPVQSRHPHLQPKEFLQQVRTITEKSGTALIFDEVVTGFRVHPQGCQGVFGIKADMATYGKVVAGGMPIGVLAGKTAYLDTLDGGAWQYGDDSFPEVGVTFFAGTFVRHPLTLAAMKAVLLYLEEQGPELQKTLNQRTENVVRRINAFFDQHHVPAQLEHFASFFYFAFPPEERFASLFFYYLRLKGIYILEGYPCFINTAHSDADIEKIVSAFQESVLEMQAHDLLPKITGSTVSEVTNGSAEQVVEVGVTEPQLEIWLADQLSDEASCSYNESFNLSLRGTLDETVLKKSLHEFVCRHQALRARFNSETQSQVFVANLALDIPTHDLRTLGAEERALRLRGIISTETQTRFQLATGPLIRAQLVRLEDEHAVLIVTVHHIVCDGWSTNVLLDELPVIYNALKRGEAYTLSAPMLFADYARQQKTFCDSAEGGEVERYWLDVFRTVPPPLDLPIDHHRPALKEYSGATYRTHISAENYQAIKKMAARQKCTLFSALLAGFQILLSRLSGQTDIVVGIPTAGQSLLEDQILVGHCVNFIPLRESLDGNPIAADYLRKVKQTVLDGYDHQNYTYGRLVRKLQIPRDLSRLPLTEVQFNLERVGGNTEFDGLKAEAAPNPKSFVNFDIFLNIIESANGLTLYCDYNTGLIEESTIARWMSHYKCLLLGMVDNPDLPVSRLPLLTEQERKQIVHDWNATKVEFPQDVCVHQLISEVAKRKASEMAVVFEGARLSYRELDRRANQLANYLQRLGARPGVRVGVFIERSLDMMVAILGVLKSGAAYVPVDPIYPPERIAFVMDDAQAPVIVTKQSMSELLPEGKALQVCMDSDWPSIAEESIELIPSGVTADDLAYTIYTSGSTGKPKGVEIPNRALVNLLLSMSKTPGFTEQDVMLAVTTLSFDIAGLELFLPLIMGGRLVIASRETAADGAQILSSLREQGVTVMQATPITWKLLLEAGWEGDPKIKVLCGGEAFPRDLANKLAERASSVWNMYGPTETTIWSSTARVEKSDLPVPLGPPIDNTQFYVLDKELQLQPAGVPGELHIGGVGLARGYFRRPELTAEKFISDPYSDVPSARMYKTGDLVRQHSDGAIEFLGRLDYQVKLRGFRIELGEIETAIMRHSGVKESVVIIREDVAGDKRLVGYITSKVADLSTAEVRASLQGKLPVYMIPPTIVLIEAMPLTPNGKIDRRALPAPELTKKVGTDRVAEIAPVSEKARTLAAIWKEVLHLEQVSVHDDLFELGADSLHVFQIVSRANRAGIPITARLLLQQRTISTLCSTLPSKSTSASTSSIRRVSRDAYRVTANVVQGD